MQSSASPTKIPVPFASSQTSTYVQAVPTTTSTPGAFSWNLGSGSETFLPTTSGGTPPKGEYFNGLMLQITQCLRWIQAGGVFTKDLAFQSAIGGYPKGAILANAAGTGFWISTVENNLTDPDAGGAGWSVLTPATYPWSSITGAPSFVLNSAFTGANQSLGTNGFQKFPGGMIEQWGAHTNSADNEFVSFPITFPNGCFNVTMTQNGANPNSSTNIGAYSLANNGFFAHAQSQDRPFFWRAIGY